jgi:Domain of unknown function (DUF222)/HNH endonuclease
LRVSIPIELVYDRVVDMPPIDTLDELIAAIAFTDRYRAHVAVAAAGIATSGEWAADGSVSICAWLQQHCRLSRTAANVMVHEGRFLRRFPAVADAALSGRLSAAQVAVIRQAVPPLLADLFDEHQHTVVDAVAELNIADTTTVCREWRARAEAIVDIPPPDPFRDRVWKSSRLEDGSTVGQFAFDPTSADVINQALDTARTHDDIDDTRSHGQTMADAMTTIAAFFNANHDRDISPRHRRHADITIDVHQIFHPHCDPATCPGHDTSDPAKLFDLVHGSGHCVTTADGVLLPDWASDAYVCDCVMHRVIRSASAVLDYGIAERTPPRDLFRAVAARDRGCRFPGCHRKVAFTQAHHILYWEDKGPTRIENLLLLCSYHHHLIHRQQWHIRLDPNADAHFTTPDGRVFTSKPHCKPNIRIPTAA